jgi:saccharopine dehydrogenase-like NADP-dependent oxidoreductase
MAQAKPYFISPAFAFVAYPNRDSSPFVDFYEMPEAETCIRGTLRYQGFPEVIGAWVEMGFLNDEEKEYVKKGEEALEWRQVTAKAVSAKEATEE